MLEAIRASPHDDAPRLIYADWLTAQGDPRGEFVSIQCRLAAAPEVERRKLRTRENQLLKAHARDWLAPVLAVLEHEGHDLPAHEFERGFLTSLAAALAKSEQLAGLTRLTLNDSWKSETVALFAKSPTLAAAKVYFKGKLVPKE
jgi:uncharacterized protein (TIGR02996 family)